MFSKDELRKLSDSELLKEFGGCATSEDSGLCGLAREWMIGTLAAYHKKYGEELDEENGD